MSQDKSIVSYQFQILHEEVSEVDLFEDQTHEHVSNTLVNLIESNEKAVTIGLEGSWGSGKSTVVDFLKKKLVTDGTDKTLFFIFDAWSHEGDPLRRIFLESLINKIDPGGEDQKLTHLLNEITSRTKTVRVSSEKKASKLGRLLFLSTLLVPAGAAILSQVEFSNLYWPWSGNVSKIDLTLIFGAMFGFAPFISLLFWATFGDKDSSSKIKWDFMESDSTENYTQDITEDGERTSIEFERYFEKIFEYTLGPKNNFGFKRAVIVIDNLDRVSSEHGLAVWSTLQTFFQHKHRENNVTSDWIDHLWFLVPFDRGGLIKTWSGDHTESNNSDFSSSFLSKSFQVIIEVPTPVMSAWHSYCIHSVHKSLKTWPSPEQEDVINVFKRVSSKLETSPTPRKILNFVNQVGVIGMRWGNMMSAESKAMYALLRQKHSETKLRSILLDTGLPDGFEASGDEKTIKMELAGMLFGVPKEKGIQLLIGPEIRLALKRGDGELIKELIGEHGEAFWIVWHAIKNDIQVTDSHTEEYRIAYTAALFDGMAPYKSKIKSEILNLEKVWKGTEEKWLIKLHDYENSLSMMLELVENKEGFLSWSHKTIQNKLDLLVSSIENEIDIDTFKHIESLCNFLSRNGNPIKDKQYQVLGVAEWENWINAEEQSNVLLPMVHPDEKLIEELSEMVLSNQNVTNSPKIKDLLAIIDLLPTSIYWSNVTDKITLWANSQSRELGDNDAYKLMLKMYAECSAEIADKVKALVSNAAFWRVASQENIDDVTELPVLVACILGKELQSATYVSAQVKSYWKDKSNYDQENFLKLKSLNRISVLWELSRDATNELAIEFIRRHSSDPALTSISTGLLHLNEFFDWLNEDESLQSVIYDLCIRNDLSVFKKILDTSPLQYDKALYLLQLHGGEKAQKIVKEIIESLDEEQWLESLKGNLYTLDCALNETISLNHMYTDAFQKYFSMGISSGVIDDWLLQNFEGLLNKTLDKDNRLQKLIDVFFESNDDHLPDKVFDTLSKHWNKHAKSLSDDRVLERLDTWVQQGLHERVKWLHDARDLRKTKTTESLSSRVTTYLKDEDSDAEGYVVFAQLAKSLKIKYKSTNDE